MSLACFRLLARFRNPIYILIQNLILLQKYTKLQNNAEIRVLACFRLFASFRNPI